VCVYVSILVLDLAIIVKGLLEKHFADSQLLSGREAILDKFDANIHANIEALESSLEQLQRIGADSSPSSTSPTRSGTGSGGVAKEEIKSLENAILLWKLVSALWGSTEILNSIGTEPTISFLDSVHRRTALSRWLASAIEPTIEQQLASVGGSDGEAVYLRRLFLYLTAHNLPQAVAEVRVSSDHWPMITLAESLTTIGV
jgi:hypothetical protein